ncbi:MULTISPECIES: protease modulator HflC [Vibrio]|uniref:Protein HflC n=1 Tax=Vibrio proteolyticus NBRC 13287 TaxID=1219065 RepID=U2ZNU3_VIBPR|nr:MULTISPECIES: protease modulator HflC [Vibrio]NAW57314.1 protease modulator HflC [Vibrio sp. V36_P2S2PM302]NAX20412.1 protease modulator HflC [Vibrio sp. V39_P1S14PM300]NAX27917.1 protease modulator HflC [Vibrio sp. V38_P2S17PM301]NAX30871.1 protease modulator HflC [Vibrio sp. V37_P2S8PM304]GAD69426.1 FtsH protease regulator HflC [Vibrio proteolyticus NBRC 13287]
MRKLMIPLLVFVLALMLMSLFVIPEGERGIVIRFGRVLKDDQNMSHIYEPGLHLKLPLFDRVKTLDARIQTMDGRSDRFVTSEKKDVIIDSYVKWRIEDFGQYYLATGGGNTLTAEALLERKVTDVLRSEIGSREIKQIVSGPRNNDVLPDSADADVVTTEAAKEALEIDGQRDQIMDEVLNDTRESAMKDLGVRVVDFRMKKINLPDEISESIYRRMRAERESVARKHRSQGREKAEVIRAQAELEVATILAEADKTARVTRGEADAQAAKIYSDVYSKDPEFFAFLRSLKAYEKSFSEKSDILVLDPKSDFFRYMKDSNGAVQK